MTTLKMKHPSTDQRTATQSQQSIVHTSFEVHTRSLVPTPKDMVPVYVQQDSEGRYTTEYEVGAPRRDLIRTTTANDDRSRKKLGCTN